MSSPEKEKKEKGIIKEKKGQVTILRFTRKKESPVGEKGE